MILKNSGDRDFCGNPSPEFFIIWAVLPENIQCTWRYINAIMLTKMCRKAFNYDTYELRSKLKWRKSI